MFRLIICLYGIAVAEASLVEFWKKRQQQRDSHREKTLAALKASGNYSSYNQLRATYCAHEKTPLHFQMPTHLSEYLYGDPYKKKSHALSVKEHVCNLRQAIYMYQEGDDLERANMAPQVSSKQYSKYLDRAAQTMARRLQSSSNDFVVGILGDSVSAGEANCYYDSWVPTFQRLLAPVFSLFGKTLRMRNVAHNGGLGAEMSFVCADSLLDTDLDALVIAFLGVGYHGQDSSMAMETVIRRALSRQQLVFSHTQTFGHYISTQYHEYGVTTGLEQRIRWEPAPRHRTFGGGIGDDRCHCTSTRSGGAPVFMRNWHPGPLGHEARADMYALRWLTILSKACDILQTTLEDTPQLPPPIISPTPFWTATHVCSTTMGPVFTTNSVLRDTTQYIGTQSHGRNTCAAKDCPSDWCSCVHETLRSKSQCQHKDVYMNALSPTHLKMTTAWQNVHTILLCFQYMEDNAHVQLESTCTRVDFSSKCRQCSISKPLTSMQWSGSPVDFIIGLGGEPTTTATSS